MSILRVKSYNVPLFFIKIVLLFVLFYFMNFDRALNLDFQNYEENFYNDWRQFEIGFEFLSDIFKFFSWSFSSFWTFILVLEVVLISILYRNNVVFLFAFPNLIFLSQGMLGTQIRFGLAICIFLVIFSFFYKRKSFWLVSLVPVFFHNAIVIVYFLANFVRYLLDSSKGLLLKRNVFWILLFVLLTVFTSFLIEYLLKISGYYYYVGTKFQEGRSLSSLLYMLISFLMLSFLARKQVKGEYSEYVYLGLVMILFSIMFYQSSIISGRFSLVYTMLEPFVLFVFYNEIGKKKLIFPIFIFYCIFCYLKVSAIELKV